MPVLSYLDQYVDELQQVGDEPFRRLYPWPNLVVIGMAGDLGGSRASGTSIINVADSVLERGSITGRVFPLVKSRDAPRGPITIGRTADSDIVIPEYSISRKHCFISQVDGLYRISDCGSANGTVVDGVVIEKNKPHKLQGGECLTLGRLLLLFLPQREFISYIRRLVPPPDFA